MPVWYREYDSERTLRPGVSGDYRTEVHTMNAKLPVYDKSIDHQILVCDIKNQTIVQMDLNRCEGDFNNLTSRDCVVWEWCTLTDPNCHFDLGIGLDDAKIRYSSYWKRDVVIACSSSGWAAVIDYEAKSLLWEAAFDNCPHSVELMPNGDMVLAGSCNSRVNGELVYLPFSKGQFTASDIMKVPSCHGVQWDPVKGHLWVLAFFGVIGVGVDEENKFFQIDGVGAEFGEKDLSGHDLSPVYGEPGKYWVTAAYNVWQFDSETSTLTNVYDRVHAYSRKHAKGIAYFPDGTMVACVGGIGENLLAGWATKALCVTTFKLPNEESDKNVVLFDDRDFYKVRTFCKEYQA